MRNFFMVVISLLCLSACDKISTYSDKKHQNQEYSAEITNREILKVHTLKKWSKRYIQYNNALRIQALEDDIEITELKINRGNCIYSLWDTAIYPFPKTFKFGETVDLGYDYDCHVLEVSINTNFGLRTFKFD